MMLSMNAAPAGEPGFSGQTGPSSSSSASSASASSPSPVENGEIEGVRAAPSTGSSSSAEYPTPTYEDFSNDRYGFSAEEQNILNEMMKSSNDRLGAEQQQSQSQNQKQNQNQNQNQKRPGNLHRGGKNGESSVSSRITAVTELESPYDTDGMSVSASVTSGSVDVVRSRLSNEEVAFLWGEHSTSESNDEDDGNSSTRRQRRDPERDFDGSISPITHNSSSHSTGRMLLQKTSSSRSMGSKRAQIRRAFSSTSLYSVGEHGEADEATMEQVMANMTTDEWAMFHAAMERGEDFHLHGHTFQNSNNQNIVSGGVSTTGSVASTSTGTSITRQLSVPDGLSPVTETNEKTRKGKEKRRKMKKQSSKRSVRSTPETRSPKKSPGKRSSKHRAALCCQVVRCVAHQTPRCIAETEPNNPQRARNGVFSAGRPCTDDRRVGTVCFQITKPFAQKSTVVIPVSSVGIDEES